MDRIKGFFGLSEDEKIREEEERRAQTKERLSALGEVIDEQVAAMTVLEARWQQTYQSIESLVAQRDGQDAAFDDALTDMEEGLMALSTLAKEAEAPDDRQQEGLTKLYEESRFYVRMADTLKDMIKAHEERLKYLLSFAQEFQAGISAASGATLSAAILCARYGEDAAEFAAICDKIRVQMTGLTERVKAFSDEIAAEQQAYGETFGQLESLTEQLASACEAIASLHEGGKDKGGMDVKKLRNAMARIGRNIVAMREMLARTGSFTGEVKEETQRFRAIDEQEAKSRADIEAVAQEIHQLIPEA